MKKRLAVLILLVAIVVIALLWWRENRRYDGPVQQVTAGAEQIARGRYLAQAADCAACHTASGGAPLAGGYPLETPFGTIYGSNLTPSADHSIGRWTRDDFFLALTQGVPTFMQVFAAVTQEMQVESAILAEEIVKQNPSLHEALLAELTALGQRQGNTISVRYISHQAFKAQTEHSRAVIRSGECSPYANLILCAGVTF